jgi:[protein-PII] uridylyltransferase
MQQESSPTAATPSLLQQLSDALVPELKRYVARHRAQVEELIAEGGPDSGLAACRRHAKAIDGLISSLFHATRTALLQGGAWRPVTVGGVGSYGRNSLSIYSDLDVRLLVEDDLDAAVGVAEALLYPLWDAGLPIGHQVVTADGMIELARTDLPTATSLLDWRHLSGEREVTERFQQRAFEEVFNSDGTADFIGRLCAAADSRRERFGGSVFLLEPDLKNGAGALRDLDLAHWAARARWRVGGLHELVRVGVLLPDEWEDIEHAIQFVVRVRNALHHLAGRRQDRLGFEEQERLALTLGYGSGGPGVEAFMSDYYRHAREIERTSEMVLRRATPPPKTRPTEVSIGSGLKLVGETVAFEDYDLIYSEPGLVFAVYEEAIHRGLVVHDASRRAIMRASGTESFRQQLRNDAESARVFRRLCCAPTETHFKNGSVLTELHEVGLLLAVIPEFTPVVGRVHNDIYHVYTVDVHSIAAVDMMRRVFRGELKADKPLATRLAEEVDRPEVLFFATLLHDIGKDQGGRGHPERGAVLADAILRRLRFSDEAIGAVQHLIRKHLSMYLVATRRDLDDPRTLEGFVEAVQGTEGLRELYLLTVADVATTSPTGLTPWKQRMLDELYYATLYWFQQGDTRRGATEQITRDVLALLPEDFPRALAEEVLASMPQRYLAANDPRCIVDHLSLMREGQKEDVRVSMLRIDGPYAEIAILANDHPGLLSQITAAISHQKLKVIGAQVYSWDPSAREGAREVGPKRALDVFWVRARDDGDAIKKRVPALEKNLQQLVAGEIDVGTLVSGTRRDAEWRLRPAPPVQLQVRVDNAGASKHTIVEVITKDRVDLLHHVSTALHAAGLTIDLAKIHTEGVRVTDVFYVATPEGNKVTDPDKIEEVKARIATTLQNLEEGE